MPQLAFANSFWESYDVLKKPVKAGVRKAMQKFQQLTVPELHADKGLHLESVERPPTAACGPSASTTSGGCRPGPGRRQ